MKEEITLTQEEIRHRGLQALTKELGTVNTIRFLQQFSNGSGNYTEERHQWLDGLDMKSIVQSIMDKRAESNG